MPRRETWLAALTGAGAALLAMRSLARVEVSGTSMVPTLLPGDRLLVWKPGAARARVGDLVVLPDPRTPDRPLVKRVTAVDPWTGVEVAGDNPAASTDSRIFGRVPAGVLSGRVCYRYAPPERAGSLPRGT